MSNGTFRKLRGTLFWGPYNKDPKTHFLVARAIGLGIKGLGGLGV